MHKKISGIATQVAETVTHKDIDGDGKVGSKTATTIVNAAEGQTGMDFDGDGKIAGKERQVQQTEEKNEKSEDKSEK